MEKRPFLTKEKLEEIVKQYPTPFHIYDEKGIRENAKKLKEAFAWNPGYKEYFAVKATPNPFILNILKEFGCGTDCSSETELMMADALGFSGSAIILPAAVLAGMVPVMRMKRKLSGLPYCILCMVPSVLYAGVYFACKLGLLSLAAS